MSDKLDVTLASELSTEKIGSDNLSVIQILPSQEATGSYATDATDDQIKNLRHVCDSLPLAVYLVTFAGAAQCFAYYGATFPLQNYIQNPPGDPLLPGVLDLGQSHATIINNAFLFFRYLIPTFVGVVADAWLGRYKTLLVTTGLSLLGCTLLFVTSLPAVTVVREASIAGLILGCVFLGTGQAGARVIIYPLLAEQLPEGRSRVIQSGNGELVVVDRAMTIQYIFNMYFWMVNIAGLAGLATTSLERHVGFWAAYLLPVCFLTVAVIPLLVWNRHLVKPIPQGTPLFDAAKICQFAVRSRFHLSAASPTYQLAQNNRQVSWSAEFFVEIQRALRASRVIFSLTIFWLCFDQISNNLISQAGQMVTGNIPNDAILAFNPMACIILGPILQKGLFPLLARQRVTFGPIARISVAFIFMALGMGYAAMTQRLIYTRGPCYDHPLACSAALVISPGKSESERRPNDISVWVQIPMHFILGVGELLGFVSLSEYAYSQAPKSMKSVLQSFESLTAGMGAALSMALGPVAQDPHLVILYATLAGVLVINAAFFRLAFSSHSDTHPQTQGNSDTSAGSSSASRPSNEARQDNNRSDQADKTQV